MGEDELVILEHAILEVIPGREDELLRAFEQARPIISSMPGFVGMNVHRCLEKPNEFLLLVRWTTLEDHTIGFRESPEYLEWKRLLHHLYDPFPEITHFAL